METTDKHLWLPSVSAANMAQRNAMPSGWSENKTTIMMAFKQYRFGFDPWGLILFLFVMLPTFIWLAFPAPNDVLRRESATSVADTIAMVCQVMFVACMCFLINKGRSKRRFPPLVIASIVSVAVYYTGWVFYYCGNANPWVILLLTIPPCAAFILFTVERKNLPATLFAVVFAVCHMIYAVKNYLI